jgi:hypothetical protein
MHAELMRMSRELEDEKDKIEDLLHEMLPKKIADQLTQGHTVTPGETNENNKIYIIIFNSFTADHLHRLNKKNAQHRNKIRQTLTNVFRTRRLDCVFHFYKLSRAVPTLSYVTLR